MAGVTGATGAKVRRWRVFNVSRYLGAVVVMLAAAGGLSAQVEIDRILQRVGDQVITQLDVRRARLLKLVPAAETTDADIQRELENHWLMVAEVARFNPAAPDEAALAGERDRWRAQFDTAEDMAALLVRAGSTDAELDAWFADVLRIRAYLANRFGMVPAEDRQAAIDDWVQGLRARAGLR